MSSQDDSQETANQFDDLVQTRLPLSKVKKIAKVSLIYTYHMIIVSTDWSERPHDQCRGSEVDGQGNGIIHLSPR